ncbi:MAG TPA: DUF6489 family protein [Ferrovibrio sp.]|jgi:hypothetical protein|uniref:DUF6489 family protein n=1 Tax=Ferrovibrio sp. TaxID=1917215 RepID=UPI002B4B0F7C|nr:DUF6489 family protein [Ferrovibrio sp.]HLT75742.1 DUF6489 family protein [Ferrovibrio sp.]
MKITVNVDCTPEEARRFLGLPDVQPLQDAVMQQLQERMMSSLNAMDPETLLRTWAPLGLQNLEQIQKFFFSQLQGGFGGGTSSTDKKK